MSTPLSIADLCFGDADSNLRHAAAVIEQLGQQLRNQPRIVTGLTGIDQLLTRLDQQMSAVGLPSMCTTCGQGPHGGCCFADMADEADVALLTINLLLIGDLATFQPRHGECRFLGPYGCSLACKPVFCLSYSCPQMHQQLSAQDLSALDAACGDLLDQQLILEAHIRDLILGSRLGAARPG